MKGAAWYKEGVRRTQGAERNGFREGAGQVRGVGRGCTLGRGVRGLQGPDKKLCFTRRAERSP